MNRLRKSASPAMTWFGGIVWRPSALRAIESTTKTLVNDETMISSPGATERSVTPRRVTIESAGDPLIPLMEMVGAPEPPPGPVGPTGGVGLGIGLGTACARPEVSSTMPTTLRMIIAAMISGRALGRSPRASAAAELTGCSSARAPLSSRSPPT